MSSMSIEFVATILRITSGGGGADGRGGGVFFLVLFFVAPFSSVLLDLCSLLTRSDLCSDLIRSDLCSRCSDL